MVAFAHPPQGGTNGGRTRDVPGPLLSDQSLRLKTFRCGRVGYVRATGPLDLGATGLFRQQMRRLLEAGCRTLIVDLSGVPFADSEGVRLLLQLRDEAEKRGARLRVVVPPGSSVERTLRLLRFDSLFAVFRSAAAAWRRRVSREIDRER